MRIEKVTIKGFLGKKDVCLDFFDSKDPLSSVGTHDVFVIGSVEGGGKTMLLDIIYSTLWQADPAFIYRDRRGKSDYGYLRYLKDTKLAESVEIKTDSFTIKGDVDSEEIAVNDGKFERETTKNSVILLTDDAPSKAWSEGLDFTRGRYIVGHRSYSSDVCLAYSLNEFRLYPIETAELSKKFMEELTEILGCHRVVSDGRGIHELLRRVALPHHFRDNCTKYIRHDNPDILLIWGCLPHSMRKLVSIFSSVMWYSDSVILLDNITAGLSVDRCRNLANMLTEWNPTNQYILTTSSYEVARGVPTHRVFDI